MPRNKADPLVKRRDIDAFETALSAHPNRIYWDVWVVTRSTACRISDVLFMQFTDVNQHYRWTYKMQKQKKTSKDGKPLPQRVSRKRLNKRAREVIRVRREHAAEGQVYVFASGDPRRNGRPLTRQSVWRVWKLAAKQAGIKDVNVSTHTARKTTGLAAWKATNGDAARVSYLLQQKDLQSVSAYLGLNDEDADQLSEACG